MSTRRAFITLLGSAAVWPRAARAQSSMPVIGFLHPGSADGATSRLRALRRGLKETGYIEGENVAVDYRWAENDLDRLPVLAGELARRQVTVIVATGSAVVASAAKAASTRIPIVFTTPEDPVRLGLVASLARPGGNANGINFFSNEVLAKRLELLRELVPAAVRFAVLVDPADGANAQTVLRDVDAAGRTMGLKIQIVNASSGREIDGVFAT